MISNLSTPLSLSLFRVDVSALEEQIKAKREKEREAQEER